MANVFNILSPDRFVLGGGVATDLGERYLANVRKWAEAFCFTTELGGIEASSPRGSATTPAFRARPCTRGNDDDRLPRRPERRYDGRILLIECADRKELIHAVTGVLSGTNSISVSNDEFVDEESGRFFMRTEAEGKADAERIEDEIRSLLPAGALVRFSPLVKRRLVILVSKEYHCLGDLLLHHTHGDLDATIEAVVGNHADLEALAGRFGIRFHLVSHEARSREEHEAEVLEALRPHHPEFLVLAKYMRILSPEFIARFPSRMVDIHHSFLPAFVGPSPYRQASQKGREDHRRHRPLRDRRPR